MDLLNKINDCSSDEEVDEIITKEISEENKNSTKVQQLGFLDYGNCDNIFKGFIPLDTRIKYSSEAMETYGMQTTDYFYEFARFSRKNNITDKGSLTYYLESFINKYFGYFGKTKSETVFNDIAWQTTETEEEYFEALDKNKIGDLKEKGAAECTERSALAQQILSLFKAETYYCMGCVDLGDRQEAHCFNIIKTKKAYALLDYSLPVASYDHNGSVKTYYPFIGKMTNEEFDNFVNNGTLKSFNDYQYNNGKEEIIENSERIYAVGSFKINKNKSI